MGEKWPRILPKVATSTSRLGSFTCRNFTTWDRRLYFPSEGRRTEEFFAWKIRLLRFGLNPRTWVPKASTLPPDHRSRLRKCHCWGNIPSTFLAIGIYSTNRSQTNQKEKSKTPPQQLKIRKIVCYRIPGKSIEFIHSCSELSWNRPGFLNSMWRDKYCTVNITIMRTFNFWLSDPVAHSALMYVTVIVNCPEMSLSCEFNKQ